MVSFFFFKGWYFAVLVQLSTCCKCIVTVPHHQADGNSWQSNHSDARRWYAMQFKESFLRTGKVPVRKKRRGGSFLTIINNETIIIIGLQQRETFSKFVQRRCWSGLSWFGVQCGKLLKSSDRFFSLYIYYILFFLFSHSLLCSVSSYSLVDHFWKKKNNNNNKVDTPPAHPPRSDSLPMNIPMCWSTWQVNVSSLLLLTVPIDKSQVERFKIK